MSEFLSEQSLSKRVADLTGADRVELGRVLQELWSGYGVIRCAELHGVSGEGSALAKSPQPLSVVIKQVDLSSSRPNARGWDTQRSHERKVTSYRIERRFYETYASRCLPHAPVPKLFGAEEDSETGILIVLSNLDDLGFDQRRSTVGQSDIRACLMWLANFHAAFMYDIGDGLWPTGTYWHLATRPDELAAMPNGHLKRLAATIDRRLNSATFQTLVHGDAKVANFCFREAGSDQVAAVDFQYVGRGCGMKDVAYFISSCLDERQAEEMQEELLAWYFDKLSVALRDRGSKVDTDELEAEWRELYTFAWADFCRFLAGWSPGHWKLNTYTDRLTQRVIDELDCS